jgi:serpin B
MTDGGAAGDTAAQLATTLHFSLPPARLHQTFDALDLALEAPPPAGAAGGAFRLSLVNALWGQRGFAFLPAYLDLLATNYGAGVHVVDFASATEAARETINQWVSQETSGAIPELFTPGILDPTTVFVLTNAVYFHASWHDAFQAASASAFQAPTGAVQVPMMATASQTTLQGAMGAGYTTVTIPYEGGTTSMVLIVPDANTFDAFTSALTFDALDTIVTGTPATPFFLTMPSFSFRTTLALADVLAKMGMPNAFAPGLADFSGIDGGHDIFIKAVVHDAWIAVDEKGTIAAAATGVVGDRKAATVGTPLIVDRPFLFAIRDDATGTILFLGRVLDPTKM